MHKISILNKIKVLKKTAFAVMSTALLLPALLLPTQVFAASSVWKVSKGDDYLYIGGTVHILPASQFPLPVEFEQAYIKSDILVLEVQLPDPTDQKVALGMMQQLSYGAGDKLSTKLSPKVLNQLDTYLQSFGLSAAQFDGFKPGFIAIQSAVLEMQKANMAGEGVDHYFAKRATADNKQQHYLESLEFQLSLLANLGAGQEEQFIRQMVDKNADMVKLLQQSIAAWRQGDLTTIDTLLLKDSKNDDPITYQQMFTQRNMDWVPKISAMFDNQQREFILVGVGHLPGDDGVLKLLEAAGYRIEQL